jgi:hypothetical protein
MPMGTGAELLRMLPEQDYVMDPGAFFAMTRGNVQTPRSHPHPGAAQPIGGQLLQVGIVSKLRIVFEGQAVVSTAAATTGDQWPYNLLKGVRLTINGQNDVWSCDGIDLHVLRFTRYPAYEEAVDLFPGSVGGGNSVGTGTYPIYLTWELPIAMDDTSLIGSLFAQSPSTSISYKFDTAANADLFSANPANVAITGTWYVQETLWEVPFDSEGKIVLPDLSRIHGFNAVDTPFNNVGEVRTELIRSAGQLCRLFVTARSSATNRLSAAPNAATTKKIDKLRVEYGGNQRPLDYTPSATLLSINNQHYGASAPYERLVADFLRENPPRDLVYLQGVTELAVVPTVNAAVVPGAGSAVRVTQETLY